MKAWLKNPYWTTSMPIWVSRPTADKLITNFEVPGWLFMLIGTLILFNILLWGLIGLVTAVSVIL